jgi:hypothetical protein
MNQLGQTRLVSIVCHLNMMVGGWVFVVGGIINMKSVFCLASKDLFN